MYSRRQSRLLTNRHSLWTTPTRTGSIVTSTYRTGGIGDEGGTTWVNGRRVSSRNRKTHQIFEPELPSKRTRRTRNQNIDNNDDNNDVTPEEEMYLKYGPEFVQRYKELENVPLPSDELSPEDLAYLNGLAPQVPPVPEEPEGDVIETPPDFVPSQDLLNYNPKPLKDDIKSKVVDQIVSDTPQQVSVEIPLKDIANKMMENQEEASMEPDDDKPIPVVTNDQLEKLQMRISAGEKFRDEKAVRNFLGIDKDYHPEYSYYDIYVRERDAMLNKGEVLDRKPKKNIDTLSEEDKQAIQLDNNNDVDAGDNTKEVVGGGTALIDDAGKLKYPFNSKLYAYNKLYGEDNKIIPKPRDQSLKTMKKQSLRPTYSKQPNSWQMDIMFTKRRAYLILININTRYLFMEPISNKSEQEITRVLKTILANGTKIDYIKGDAEKGFVALQKNPDFKNIHMTFDPNPYTYHNKIVDSVIRTLRNAAGYDPNILENKDLVKQLVDYYNKTPHNGLLVNKEEDRHYTPLEMQNNVDLEWEYIRSKDRQLADIVRQQKLQGLTNYQIGNIILMYIDRAKTAEKFKKRRRNFEDVGAFIEYRNGNVYAYVITQNRYAEIPIFYTKKIAESIDTCSKALLSYFNIGESEIQKVRELMSPDDIQHESKEEDVTPGSTLIQGQSNIEKATNENNDDENFQVMEDLDPQPLFREKPKDKQTKGEQTKGDKDDSEEEDSLILDNEDIDDENDII